MSTRWQNSIAYLVKGASHLAIRLLCVFLIVLAGELFFRGGRGVLAWLAELPVAGVLSAVYLLLWLFALELVFSLRTASLIVAAVFWAFSLADRAKFAKLGQPVLPSDLLLSRQYAQVAYMVWGKMIYVVIAIAVLALLGFVYWLKRRRIKALGFRGRSLPGHMLRVLCLVLAVSLVVGVDYNFKNARFRHSAVASQLDAWGVSNLNWDPVANVQINGQLLSFLMNAKAMMVHPPQGYGQEQIDQAFDGLNDASRPESRAGAGPIDVVVIMSEALWDPGALPGIRYSDPLLNRLSFAHRGVMFSPVFGGYTANTEFEFLTRLTNANLPVGSIPYMQYVNQPFNTLITDFREAGYRAVAVHPFDGKFWNRSHVYPRLGFENFIDGSKFTYREMTPPYISDKSMAQEIIATVEEGGGAHFVFAVSVQNHGAYLDGTSRYAGEKRVDVIDDHHALSDGARDILSTYATGVRDAALAYADVVDHYRQTGKPAIVVMFGDHLPFLGDDYLVYTQSGFLGNADQNLWSAHDQEHMHGVPVFAWSNLPGTFQFPTKSFSPIYLGSMIKRFAGIPDKGMDALLGPMMAEYPVMSQFYTRSRDGQVLNTAPPRSGIVKSYDAVAYDLLLGRNYAAKMITRDATPASCCQAVSTPTVSLSLPAEPHSVASPMP